MVTPCSADELPAKSWDPEVWPDRDAAFYAAGLDISSYEERVGGLLSQSVGTVSSLLDFGAGDGRLGVPLVKPGGVYVAVEPNGWMRDQVRRRLASHPSLEGRCIAAKWPGFNAAEAGPHAVVLCANIGPVRQDPEGLHDALRPLATQAMVWVVPAQPGPSSFCLSGLLPRSLHQSSVIPAHRGVLRQLRGGRRPAKVLLAHWSFNARFPTPKAAIDHLIEMTALPPTKASRLKLLAALGLPKDADEDPSPCLLSVPKVSALLIWR